ncbi:MAG: aspartate/glutamate racemase family protein [Alphaproteobacteria bacterium]|nr:aspartate/glutamate racemase family protein [Alphaproteobacteria bacterium]
MKVIGLIGGMSWVSSAEYYRLINEAVQRRLGGQHSARSIMISVDFAEIEAMQAAGAWDEAAAVLSNAARRLERGGADLVVLCTNTMHIAADAIVQAIRIPFLHIADATALSLRAAGIDTVGLLGTRYTMEHDYYVGRLQTRYGLRVLVPPKPDRDRVHAVIYDELCHGVVNPQSKADYLRTIAALAGQGARGVILGCTEIGLLVRDGEAACPPFDTTRLHAERAVDLALADDIRPPSDTRPDPA